MSLDSSIFLFLALPLILLLYFIVGKKLRNVLLFAVNLILYAFGEPIFILLLLCSMAINFASGILISKLKESNPKFSKVLLIVAICINLGLLAFFKYFMFLSEIINSMLGWFGILGGEVLKIALPLGISFYTFQAISYVVDVYKKEIVPAKNFIKFGVYFSLFAQITAGPIVRYKDIESQLDVRPITLDGFACGIKRFIIGLGQKIILANYFAKVANEVFNTSALMLGGATAWVGILFYTLQIYFDFAGYSSMAIGIAKMLGFTLKENFDYPYVSSSVTEFWRRWHISLSTWFRDYVYFPLGGNRKGKFRMYFGLGLVFVLSGIWHGAALTFIIWGAYHAIFIILEKIPAVKTFLKKVPKILKHVYTILIIVVGWVFFRAPDVTYAFDFLGSMLFVNGLTNAMPTISPALCVLAIVGVIGSTPILSKLNAIIANTQNNLLIHTVHVLSWIALLIIFAICIPIILTGSTTPFIYAQF